ncbi:hypothetical protein [Treponema sp.]|uniref:hypothetical protein n=1 Tax=Treponema sp. TaxID=166 RepID=UPI00388EBAFB
MKKIIFTLAAFSLASFTFAQDFGFEDSSSGFEESSTPSVAITGEVGAETRAWIGTTNEDSGLYDTKGYDGIYDVSKTTLDAGAYANLELNYEGDYTGANLKLKLSSATLEEHPEDVIDEVSASGSFKDGVFQLKAGKLKEVWGKGDKVHVLDNFNANDYTDFIFPDYIDRRIGEVMFKATANLSWDYNLKLEGIFTPWMTPDRFASSGYLVPNAQKELTETVEDLITDYVGANAANSATAIPALMYASNFDSNTLYTNTKSLKFSQSGVRLTGSFAGIDWGASYYYGHYKQPSADLKNTVIYKAFHTSLTDGSYTNTLTSSLGFGLVYQEALKKAAAAGQDITNQAVQTAVQAQVAADLAALYSSYSHVKTGLPSLNYDQLQVFGLEAAFVLWKFNTRWEVAYNLTEDIAGDDPWIKNNSISWVAGFDIDLPIHNLNINIQENGSYILHSDKIKNGGFDVTGLGTVTWDMLGSNYDVDYNSDKK